MNKLDVERETSTDVTVYLDSYHLLSNDEARRLIFNLALHVWPELSEKNALRLLANESLTKRNAELEEFLKRNEEHRADIACRLADAHQVLDDLGVAFDGGGIMLTVAQRIEALAQQTGKLRAACEAAHVFVHCNSLLCEYGNHADLCKQLRAALEETK